MAGFTLLDQAEEDKLHAPRLLRIEERPFANITKRLLGPKTPYAAYLARVPADPASNESDPPPEDAGEREQQHQKFLIDVAKFRESMLFDFSTFASSIARIQFLHAANEKERERYGNEKVRIEATAEGVRDNTAELRVKLEQAQEMLKVRKEYDVLAEKITRDKNLKDRGEQGVAIEKLRAEIEELEREGSELSQTWGERRRQLDVVVGEAARLRRQIRGEKEPEEVQAEKEAEEQRKMLLDVDKGEERDGASHIGTPRPDGEDIGTPGGRERTPMPEGATPLPTHDVEMGEDDATPKAAATEEMDVS